MKYLEKTDQEEFSIAMPEGIHNLLQNHLLRRDKQEDVAFALYKPSQGIHRFSALLYKVILPEDGDRTVHGNADINPQYFKRACQLAASEKSGLALLHSHPSKGWQGMSFPDIHTETSFSDPAHVISRLPFIGLTLGTDMTWSGRIWEYNNEWIERTSAYAVRVVGRQLGLSFNDVLRPKPAFKEMYKRTIKVWGEENHASLARLRIGIVGLGSVGSMVAETLSRMGMERFVLIDFDEVQEHNLDRLLGATQIDIGQLKISVAERQIYKSSTSAKPIVKIVPYGVTEENGYKNALDCDVIFCCVDRPWPRQVLNHIAYNHLIPVIDGGIKVRFNPATQQFAGADWLTLTVGPERICLQCVGQFESSNATLERAGKLDDPSYLDGLERDHDFKNNENVFPFSMNLASLEILQFVELVCGLSELQGDFGLQRFSYNQGFLRVKRNLHCEDGCYYSGYAASGDTIFPAPTGFDHSANNARKRQELY